GPLRLRCDHPPVVKLRTPPSPPRMNRKNPYPQRRRPSTIEGPHEVLSGALKVQSFLPLAVSSAARMPESVPTNATPRTAETGAKIFPVNSSAVHWILPVAGFPLGNTSRAVNCLAHLSLPVR